MMLELDNHGQQDFFSPTQPAAQIKAAPVQHRQMPNPVNGFRVLEFKALRRLFVLIACWSLLLQLLRSVPQVASISHLWIPFALSGLLTWTLLSAEKLVLRLSTDPASVGIAINVRRLLLPLKVCLGLSGYQLLQSILFLFPSGL